MAMTNAIPPNPPTDPPAGEQPPAWTPAPRPPLRRSSTDRLAGGVCGGLAEYSGVDALLWRVGFVGLTVAGGAGVLVYLLLWVLMPPAPTAPDEALSGLEQLVRRLHTALSEGLGRPGPRP
jgi:phage shock protein PspC (stress-responsive transcriptional regulator)